MLGIEPSHEWLSLARGDQQKDREEACEQGAGGFKKCIKVKIEQYSESGKNFEKKRRKKLWKINHKKRKRASTYEHLRGSAGSKCIIK